MKKYTAQVSFADAKIGYVPGQDYELDDKRAEEYVRLGWMVEVKPAASKRKANPKVEKATAPTVETATLDA